MNFAKILLYSIGPISAALIGLVTVPLLAWVVPQEDIGRFSLYNIIISFSLIACSLGLDQSFVRYFHEADNKTILLFLCFLPGFLMLWVIAGILLCFKDYINSNILTLDKSFPLEIIILGIISAFIYRYATLLIRMQNKALTYSISQILPKLIFLSCLLIALYVQYDIDIEFLIHSDVIALCISALIFVMLTGHYWRIQRPVEWSSKDLGNLVSYGMPLVLSGLAYWGLTAQDKLFLTKFSSLEELGLYSVAMSFAGAAMILKTLFQALWAPTVFSWVHDNKKVEQVDTVTLVMVFLVTVVFCIVGMGADVITFLIPNSYESISSLVIACVGFPLFFTLSEASGIGINIVKKSTLNLYVSVFTLLINGVLNYLLIPQFGAKGAAAATIISFWFYFVLRTLYSWFYWRKFALLKLFLFPTLCLTLSIFHLFSSYEKNNLLIILWVTLFLITWLCFSSSRAAVLEFMLAKGNK